VLNFQCLVFGLYFIFLTFFPSSYLEFFCKLTNNSQNSQYLIAVDALRHFGVCFLMLGFISRTCVHIKEVSLRERVSSVFALCFVLWGAVAIYVQYSDRWFSFGWVNVFAFFLFSLMHLTSNCQ